MIERLSLKILKSKYLIWPAASISVIVFFIIAYFSNINDKNIFPETESYIYEFYTDQSNGGNSQILDHTLSDSVLRLKFLLNDGFASPYVGLSITPLANEYIRAGKYNQISLKILGRNIDRVGISLSTLPHSDNKNRNQDEMLYHSYLNISSQKRTYNLPIEQFEHPEWWKDLHHIAESEKNKPDLNTILHINIGSAFSPEMDKEKTLEIYSIALTRNNQKLFTFLGLIYIVSVLSLFGILYLITYRRNKVAEITVEYKPLDIAIGKSRVEKCLEFINSNYSNSSLTLELISKETVVTPRRIAHIIYEKYKCNFKTYLNHIRINESKRFLKQTDLTIGEIAYKVGFNTQSHFNRVFKSENGLSPTEYRTSKIH